MQSACRTFLRRLQAGDFELAGPKPVATAVRHHLGQGAHAGPFSPAGQTFHRPRTAAHAGRKESRGPGFEAVEREPPPDEAAAFADQLDNLLARLDEEDSRVVQLKLEDRTNEEIAHEMKCSERTVRRILNRVRSRLHGMLVEPSP